MSAEIPDNGLNIISPEVLPFLDKETNSFTYIVKDPDSDSCAVIDSVANYDQAAGTISYEGADAIIDHIRNHKLQLEWIIETHVHADHLTAASHIQQTLGGKLAIGEHVDAVQKTFTHFFNTGDEVAADGSQFDHLLKDNEVFYIGKMAALAIHTPGHTPACMTYLIGNAAFIGDTIFMPDTGTARADFPGGDARTLYRSIRKLLSLPGDTRLFMCHDYSPGDRELEYESSIAEQLQSNIHVNSGMEEDAFVKIREAKDKGMAVPHLILPSLQVNMRAGRYPEPESNGRSYLKIPINAFKQQAKGGTI